MEGIIGNNRWILALEDRLCLIFTARFARDTKGAETYDFSITVDPSEICFAFYGARRTIMENRR